ncbi:hypothetical protein SETIT_9G214300v2 [Setaria italica]|uniref:F-box domain-containing protein n=1 Tax=Setaria italica TaxID=4555 RepID=K4AJV8_SETIT|nr:hypothetical protein SETIT_9G214300v2 [Setaria italica]
METTASRKRTKASALPDEIVEEILARLPAKSLRRFQCVSRPWRDFIRPAGYCEPFHACRHPAGSPTTTTAVEEELLSCSQFPQWNVFPVT